MPASSRAAVRLAQRLRLPVAAHVAAAAAHAGRAQRRLRPQDVARKAVGDFVTRVDLDLERRLRRQLGDLLPDAGFLGEETAAWDLRREWVWVVDPIDGTSNFARGLPHHAVAVALLCGGQPVLGCVHNSPGRISCSAVHGLGAWCGRRRLVAPPGRFDDGAIVGSQWFRGQQDMEFLARLQARGARIRTFGSTVTQLTDVALGRLDGNVQQQGRIWDLAAAGLLAIEAGVRLTDWEGRDVFPLPDLERGHTATVAATPQIHRQILRLLRR